MKLKTLNNVIIFDAKKNQWLRFHSPLEICICKSLQNIIPTLEYLENQVNSKGLHAAGFLSFEASPAFDPAYAVCKKTSTTPLLWFGLYKKPSSFSLAKMPSHSKWETGEWLPSQPYKKYQKKIDQIKSHIAQGDTYQVNYTMKMNATFSGDPWNFFCHLAQNQQANYAAFVDTKEQAICSVSPELFFNLDKDILVSRPMKGTAARGTNAQTDTLQKEWLLTSEKNRAENVMIVDMLRNDMGKIAENRSVKVPKLFTCEKYPSVWQLTSTVSCTTKASVAQLLAALFPCASITGAPKIETMKIIQQLENFPRGIYTGSIGYIAPKRKAVFNVAIRTVVIDKKKKVAQYGVGGGIVWQSDALEEYNECQLKALVLTKHIPDFSLIETLLFKPNTGYFLLGQHCKRIAASAHYFDFPLKPTSIRLALRAFSETLPKEPHRVRLTLDKSGTISITSVKFYFQKQNTPIRLCFAKKAINSKDVFFYHKTTNRTFYEQEKATAKNYDDVIFYNEKNEVTETSIANIVIKKKRMFVTPPVTSGLLAGTFRNHLLSRQTIQERIITVDDLRNATEIYTINSVRKWQKAIIVAD